MTSDQSRPRLSRISLRRDASCRGAGAGGAGVVVVRYSIFLRLAPQVTATRDPSFDPHCCSPSPRRSLGTVGDVPLFISVLGSDVRDWGTRQPCSKLSLGATRTKMELPARFRDGDGEGSGLPKCEVRNVGLLHVEHEVK